jgi:hypothetical protein
LVFNFHKYSAARGIVSRKFQEHCSSRGNEALIKFRNPQSAFHIELEPRYLGCYG